MKNKIIYLLFISILAVITNSTCAQIYRAAVTDALENNGKEWVEKKLPPSVITFSDYSGQLEIKAALSSLFTQKQDSIAAQSPADTLANFTMTLDKEQVQQQITAGKTFTTTGLLNINNISKKTTAQCLLEPRNNPADGFIISVVIRFNPGDYGLKVSGETENTGLMVRVTRGYLNKQQNNF